MNSLKAASLESSNIEPKKTDNVAYLHGNIEILQVSQIKCNVKTQQRIGLNLQTVEEYKKAISLGAKFPPIKVCFDGKNYWLWDGFHTVQVYSQLEKTEIAAEVSEGTLRDAILLSVGANYNHGLRRTREDKRKAILTLLYDEEWSEWSNREIARKCKVDHKTVSKIRSEITYKSPANNTKDDKSIITGEFPSDNPRKYKDKYGNESIMDIGGIGKKSNLINDKSIITDGAYKPSNSIRGTAPWEKRTSQTVEITSDYRKGEQGIIGQKINSNQTLIEFPDGTKEVFSNYNFVPQLWNSGDEKTDRLLNQASHAFSQERPMVKMGRRTLARELNIGQIVLIDPPDRIDPNLVGYTQKYAEITNLYSYSADIKIWNKEIKAVSVADLKPLDDEFVSPRVSVKPQVYAQLMSKFSNLEQALEYAVIKKEQHPGFSNILKG